MRNFNHHTNGENGFATWFYIDEFHVLLNSQYTAEYLQQLWKKVRKPGGLCTGITQNVANIMASSLATTMLSNIKCGSVVIPFDNQIGKNELYQIYNTNLHEKILEQKKSAITKEA